MSDVLIEASAVRKYFSRNDKVTRSEVGSIALSALLGRRSNKIPTALDEDGFAALDNISFQVKRGEALGIIGRNGAGKTTLLNILAGFSRANLGEVRMHGRVVSLITLTSGMQGDLTGRENIYTKGALNGLKESAIREREQDIIDFSELDLSIDAPFKTYSSGMKMRLAFAINIHSEADIFIVDEVLSVGDFAFRNKCYDYFQTVKKNSAVVLVSHSMNDITKFCDRAILLQKGVVKAEGNPQSVISAYQSDEAQKQKEKKLATPAPSSNAGGEIPLSAENLTQPVVSLNRKTLQQPQIFGHGTPAHFEFDFSVKNLQTKLSLSLVFYKDSQQMFNLETESDHCVIALEPENEEWVSVSLKCSIESFPLVSGTYSPVLVIHDGRKYLLRKMCAPITVEKDRLYRMGEFSIPKQWSVTTSADKK
jgi:ABC-type polysaccharide/polyol phosphate transport system ATPase subunit